MEYASAVLAECGHEPGLHRAGPRIFKHDDDPTARGRNVGIHADDADHGRLGRQSPRCRAATRDQEIRSTNDGKRPSRTRSNATNTSTMTASAGTAMRFVALLIGNWIVRGEGASGVGLMEFYEVPSATRPRTRPRLHAGTLSNPIGANGRDGVRKSWRGGRSGTGVARNLELRDFWE